MTMATMNLKMPKKLNAASSSAVVSPDNLSVKANQPLMPNTIQSVQSNKPIPINIGSVYYFEMRVKNGASNARAAIGFTPEGFDFSTHIGFYVNGVGYRGDVGLIHYYGIDGYCSTFTINDIVGAGINYDSNEFFFTKNGEVVGTLGKTFNGTLFPTVSVFGAKEEVKVNFGHKPFVYDIKSRFPCSYWHDPVNDELRSSSTKDESLKKWMKAGESLLRKSIEEKEEEVASLKAVVEALNNLGKYL